MGPSLLVHPIYGSDFATATSRTVYLPEGEWMDFETGERFTGPATLEDYAQPFGTIPAFVGGTGILVHSTADDGVAAQVFPVAPHDAEYEYIASDGVTRSTIRSENTGWSADRIQVTESESGNPVPLTVDETTGAVEFAVTAGVDYVVSDYTPDTTPPSVEAAISKADADGWYGAGATATLSATDDDSGVETIKYRLEGAGWTPYSAGVVLPEGKYTLEYRATDEAGNTSEVQSKLLAVDETDASVWGWLDLDGRLTVVVRDALSGVSGVEYSLDGETWTASMADLGIAPTSVQVRASDVAGNLGDPLVLESSSDAPILTVEPGEVLVIDRGGFAPGEKVRVELHSDPVVLGSVTASADGLVHLTVTIPETVPAGAHSLVFVVAGNDPGPLPVVIASTGVDVLPGLVIAAILLAIGAGLILIRLRRKKGAARTDTV